MIYTVISQFIIKTVCVIFEFYRIMRRDGVSVFNRIFEIDTKTYIYMTVCKFELLFTQNSPLSSKSMS